MSRPAWSPAAFRQRILMSARTKLFLVVEGTDTDPWFYGKLLAATSIPLDKFDVYPVKSVSGGGADGPFEGKSAVLNLYRIMRRAGDLILRSASGGAKALMFCVDSDHDRIAGKIIRSPHVSYTPLPDAEAEIFDRIDMGELATLLTSASGAAAATLIQSLGDPVAEIANRWREWFEVCLVADHAQQGGPRRGSPSSVHMDGFGPCDHARLTRVQQGLASRFADPADYQRAEAYAHSRLDPLYKNSQYRLLVKGKWIAKYLAWVLDAYAVANNLGRVSSEGVVRSAAKGMANQGHWRDGYYTPRFERLYALTR